MRATGKLAKENTSAWAVLAHSFVLEPYLESSASVSITEHTARARSAEKMAPRIYFFLCSSVESPAISTSGNDQERLSNSLFQMACSFERYEKLESGIDAKQHACFDCLKPFTCEGGQRIPDEECVCHYIWRRCFCETCKDLYSHNKAGGKQLYLCTRCWKAGRGEAGFDESESYAPSEEEYSPTAEKEESIS